VALAIAAVALALIITISPYATIMANEASNEVLGINFFGITHTAKNLPEQQIPAP
jgi:hypothetical protein